MVWPPPSVPYFNSQGRFFKADWDRAGRYGHIIGHSRDIRIRSTLKRRAHLHLVLDLDLTDPRVGIPAVDLLRLPLLHPFRHDGGAAKYRVLADDTIELLEINGRILDGWPYGDYPERFAPRPFDVTEPVPCTREEFDEPMLQSVNDEHLGWFIAVVPDARIDGKHGLWSDSGGECINAVFAFDRKSRIVETYNECD